jgi:hypothetical protein
MQCCSLPGSGTCPGKSIPTTTNVPPVMGARPVGGIVVLLGIAVRARPVFIRKSNILFSARRQQQQLRFSSICRPKEYRDHVGVDPHLGVLLIPSQNNVIFKTTSSEAGVEPMGQDELYPELGSIPSEWLIDDGTEREAG